MVVTCRNFGLLNQQVTVSDSNKTFLQSYIDSSITHQPDGSYTARFPWKVGHPPLPTNHRTCEKRTRSLAYRLAQTPDLLQTYNNIADQERRGFIERVASPQPSDSCHYIPHHTVRKDSPTTPIRIVYDCSCHHSKESPSLNDCLMIGPPFLNDLCSIILQFRTHVFGISTDIEKVFLHGQLTYCLELLPVLYKCLVSFSGQGKQHYNKNKHWVSN